MGIRVVCPNGHKLNVKSFLAGKRGVCPHCGAKFDIPAEKAEASDEKVQSVGKVTSRGGTATATASSSSSTELQAGHLTKGAGAARRGVPAVTSPPAAAPLTSLGLGSGSPLAPVAPVQVAPAQPSALPAFAPQTVAAQPVGTAQPVGAQPVGGPAVPLGLAPVVVRPAIADPLAEAPEASWYVRPPSGGQYGPAKPHTMREWMAQGRITADSLVWREGWPDWKLASATFPSLGATGAPAGPLGGPPAPTGAMPISSAASDDPFAVLGPADSSASLGVSSLSTSSNSSSRRSIGSRRSDSTTRVMAIAVLCLALVVLSALLVYVLKLR